MKARDATLMTLPRVVSADVLLGEDDDDDFLLTQEALREAGALHRLHRVKDGEELMDFLLRRGAFADPATSPTPKLVLLDLNMPRKDGGEALREIKSNASLRHIPIVVLTTSKAEQDIYRAYELGVNSFITKPLGFRALVDTMKTFQRYWFELVELPAGPGE
jgi:CheY-like chemotaxis protein